MRSVLMSGASGMLGRAIGAALRAENLEITSLVRGAAGGAGAVEWKPESGWIADPAGLEGVDAAIHLSGANVSAQRWSKSYKREMVESRVTSTRVLAEALARLRKAPSVLITASATGFYGDRGDEVLDEEAGRGSGFLAELCEAWERATEPAREAGMRVVHLRFGVVLGAKGGALGKMLPLFRAGLGGRLGSGRQWMSWVSEADAVGAVLFALTADGRSSGYGAGRDASPGRSGLGLSSLGLSGLNRSGLGSSSLALDHDSNQTSALAGAVNVVAPQAVKNAEFTHELGALLHRPTWLSAPAFALRLAFGEMADEALLASARAVPAKLIQAGYLFRHPRIGDGLQAAFAAAH